MEAKYKNIKTFEQHLDERYGETGSTKRAEFEIKAKAFAIGELIKEERLLANLTQEQLAEKLEQKRVLSPELKTDTAISNFQLCTNFWKLASAEKYQFLLTKNGCKKSIPYNLTSSYFCLRLPF